MVLSFSDSFEEETILLPNNVDNIQTIIIENKNKISNTPGLSDWERLQVIDTNIALQAPPEYFMKHIEKAYSLSKHVQNIIADRNLGGRVSYAMENVNNPVILNQVYNDIESIVYDVLLTKGDVTGIDRDIVKQFIVSELIGLSVVDFLYRDVNNREIIVNSPCDVQIETGGVLYPVKSIGFFDSDQFSVLVSRLFSPLNKTLSRTTPMVKGRLKDFSRIYCVDDSVSPKSKTLNIRKHDGQYVTPDRFIQWDSVNQELLTFLGNLIYNGANYLVVGGTGSGKTTLLSSLTGFIRPNLRVMTLEDNLEMVPCPYKLLGPALECVPVKIGASVDSGVSMRDLVKGALQMRPDWLIVGEVTDGAAYDMVQALSTGHSGGSTLHSFNAHSALSRLVSMVSQGGVMRGPHEALPIVSDAIDIIITVERFPSDGSRKITGVWEVASNPIRNEHGELELPITPLWLFDNIHVDSQGKVSGMWVEKNEVSSYLTEKLHLGFTPFLSWEELDSISKTNMS